MNHVQPIFFLHGNGIPSEAKDQEPRCSRGLSVISKASYLTWVNLGSVLSGSMSVSSWNALLFIINVSRFGMYCSRLSAIRLEFKKKTRVIDRSIGRWSIRFCYAIWLLARYSVFSFGKNGNPSSLRISLLVKSIVSNWFRVAPKFSMVGIFESVRWRTRNIGSIYQNLKVGRREHSRYLVNKVRIDQQDWDIEELLQSLQE